MDWNHELLNSLKWLAMAFVITALGMSVVGFLLGRFTSWGRQVARLCAPYFSLQRGWRPVLAGCLMLFMALMAVRMNVLFSFWYKAFYNALQDLNVDRFWWGVALFSILAGVHVVRALLDYYITQSFEIHWRTWLNENFLSDWLAGAAYYRGQFLDSPIDNPDQRIQVDVDSFVRYTLKLSVGLVGALVSLFEFSLILWALSGTLALMGFEIPRAMIFVVYIYVVIASAVVFRIGRPLIGLNFLAERLVANFRYALVRLREYGESIAFYKGEAVENKTLAIRFQALIHNAWAIVYRSLMFSGANLFFSQVAVLFPFLIQAQRFFAKEIQLGDVMQTSQAFGQVHDALSFFRTSYDDFAQYRAVVNRLTDFLDANQRARDQPVVTTISAEQGLGLNDLIVRRPDAKVMVYRLQLQLAAGQSLLVRGPSGSGKTSLLRALASLWPFADGEVRRPVEGRALFLSQKPYLPLGTLRTALSYPALKASGLETREVLQKVQLGYLSDRLDEDADWSSILSLGEQQRLAFARVLINRPHIAFLDEATSATDEGLEHALYQLLRQELPQCILVSVGHRSTLTRFHSHTLYLHGLAKQGKWALEANPVR